MELTREMLAPMAGGQLRVVGDGGYEYVGGINRVVFKMICSDMRLRVSLDWLLRRNDDIGLWGTQRWAWRPAGEHVVKTGHALTVEIGRGMSLIVRVPLLGETMFFHPPGAHLLTPQVIQRVRQARAA